MIITQIKTTAQTASMRLLQSILYIYLNRLACCRRLKCNFLYAVCRTELCLFFPVWNEHFVPLPIQNFQIVLRSSAGNPVGVFAVFAVAGATGKAYNSLYTKLFCQKNGVVEIILKAFCYILVGMNRVAMASQCT